MKLKRLFDLIGSGLGLVVLSPFFIIIAIAIKVDSSGPVFFRQKRVGRFLEIFEIHKFRTMSQLAHLQGPQITVGNDSRVTRVGFFLRKYKLDELAQLIDVFRGKMSLVGPRPEVVKYVEYYPEAARNIVFSVRPGITDRASIEYKDENLILERSDDPHRDYVEKIIPVKLSYYVEYARNHTFVGDLVIIFTTLRALVR